MSALAIAHIFHVTIDNMDIGHWTGCTGLNASYDVREYDEGGQNQYSHKLPGRVKYENVTLTRAVDKSSGAVAAWFNSLAAQSVMRGTASITLYDGDLEKVATWSLSDVIPVKWSGPSLETGKAAVAEESLVLAHHGFVFA